LIPEAHANEAARGLARLVAQLALLLMAVALAWFGWVDASITDGAMLLVAVGLLFAALAAGAALVSLEAGLALDAAGRGDVAADARWRRLGLAFLVAALLVLVVAAVLTLNLRGGGVDDSDGQATAAHLAVRSAAGPAGRV
jgi:K+-transporting ATPase A subunit